jgi:hypothetical protein
MRNVFADSSLALAPITFHVHAVMELSSLRLFIERARPFATGQTKGVADYGARRARYSSLRLLSAWPLF